MSTSIYTEALARAAEMLGSTQALASLLHVPESTLLRWMSGRAKMPLQAFLNLIELLTLQEQTGAVAPRQEAIMPGEKLTFHIGRLQGRCARCDATNFAPVEAGEPLKLTSELVCCLCGERVVHGNLIAQLAKDAVNQSRAYTAARRKRQEQLLEMAAKRLKEGGVPTPQPSRASRDDSRDD